MSSQIWLSAYWQAVLDQNAPEMRKYFHEHARISWHNSNECFTTAAFIRANCEYPGAWAGESQRVAGTEEAPITVVHVYTQDRACSFHVTSFFQISQGKIVTLDEYWGDDAPPPQWRKDLGLSTPIQTGQTG